MCRSVNKMKLEWLILKCDIGILNIYSYLAVIRWSRKFIMFKTFQLIADIYKRANYISLTGNDLDKRKVVAVLCDLFDTDEEHVNKQLKKYS